MKHVVEAGTDGATLAAFDAHALPHDFDARVEEDPVGLMEALRADGRLWFGETGGDGSYIVHVLVDEPIASPGRRREAWHGRIEIPSGEFWVCGAEYTANNPQRGSPFTQTGGVGDYGMGGSVHVPPGRYDLIVIEVEYDDDDDTRTVTATQWLQLVTIGLFGLGAITAFFSGTGLVVSLAIKGGQVLLGSPLAEKGGHAIWVMLAFLVGGSTVMLTGGALSDRIERRPEVIRANAAAAAARAERPDFILALTRREEPTG